MLATVGYNRFNIELTFAQGVLQFHTNEIVCTVEFKHLLTRL